MKITTDTTRISLISNELMDVSNEHKWLLTSQKREITTHNGPSGGGTEHVWNMPVQIIEPESIEIPRSDYSSIRNTESKGKC